MKTLFVLGAAFLTVFGEAAFDGARWLTGARIDLLPALMVYAALSSGLIGTVLLAFCGGLWFDSLSANPLGISILPLFLIGIVVYFARDLVLRDQTSAQLALGLGASAAAPLLTLLLLLTTGYTPALGWGSLWQWLVMSLVGAAATPVWFRLFARLEHALVHGRATESSFRLDREIRRGR
jgi:hypothetical protein